MGPLRQKGGPFLLSECHGTASLWGRLATCGRLSIGLARAAINRPQDAILPCTEETDGSQEWLAPLFAVRPTARIYHGFVLCNSRRFDPILAFR